jgi:hypothetical protein
VKNHVPIFSNSLKKNGGITGYKFWLEKGSSIDIAAAFFVHLWFGYIVSISQ